MKIFYKISWVIFLLGLQFKLLHYPGGGVFLTLGSLLILSHAIIHFTKFVKKDLPLTLLYAAIAIMTVYLLGRLQYWSFAKPLFPFACLLSLASIVMMFVKKVKLGFSQIFLGAYFIFFFIISFTPSYKIYYFVNLNTFLNGETRSTNYVGWDKYSWFLYLQNKREEAIEANIKAKSAIAEYFKITTDKQAEEYSILIERHGVQLKELNWTTYP